VAEDEVLEWVRARLRSSRVPSVVRFRTELPYNEMGKVLRRVIRGEMG
jgi:acyl-coenzyme A synthetase/AMP-(fatty) acid ligase